MLDKYTKIEELWRRTVYNWLKCYNKDSLAANHFRIVYLR